MLTRWEKKKVPASLSSWHRQWHRCIPGKWIVVTKRNPSDKLAQPHPNRLRPSHRPLTTGGPFDIGNSLFYPQRLILSSDTFHVVQASWIPTWAPLQCTPGHLDTFLDTWTPIRAPGTFLGTWMPSWAAAIEPLWLLENTYQSEHS